MSRKTKQLILIIAAVQLMIIIGLLALPKVVIAIPGRYRVALAEKSPLLSQVAENLIEQVAPVATVPAPSTLSGPIRITIPVFIEPVQQTKTPLPTPTLAADQSAEEDPQKGSPTPLPSPTTTSVLKLNLLPPLTTLATRLI